MYKQGFLLQIILWGVNLLSYSQPFHLELFDTEQGLSSPVIYSVLQDKKGCLWVGTSVGVSRFNGYTFENFSNPGGIACNRVTLLKKDAKDDIWFLPQFLGSKLVVYIQKEELFKVIRFEQETGAIRGMDFNTKGELCISTTKKIYKIPNDEVSKIKLSQTITSENFTSFEDFQHQRNKLLYASDLYASDDGGIFTNHWDSLLYLKGGQLSFLGKTDDHLNTIDKSFLRSILPIGQDSTLVGTKYGRLYLITNQQAIQIHESVISSIHNIIEHNNFIWAVTQNDILKFSKKNLKLVHKEPINKKLGINLALCMIIDKENNFWIGTNEGLVKMSYNPFRNYLDYDPLWQYGIFSFGKDKDGKLLVGSVNSRVAIQKEKERFEEFPMPNNALERGEIIDILLDNNGNDRWFLTPWKGIQRLKNGKIKKYWYPEGIPNGANFYSMIQDEKNRILIGSEGQIFVLEVDEKTDKFSHFAISCPSVIHKMVKDRFGTIWLGGSEGLFYLQEDSIHKVEVPIDVKNIIDFKLAENDILWAATRSNGIFQFSLDGCQQLSFLSHIGEQNGLNSNYLLCVEIDDNGDVWVGSYKGISRISQVVSNFNINNYNSKDGFIDEAYQYMTLYNDKKGTIWIGTTRGLYSFQPNDIPISQSRADLHLTELTVNGNRRSPLSWNNEELIEFSHFEKSFSFEYAGISLKNNSKVKYQYKLEGLDEDWSPVSSTRKVNYNVLNPGEYEFKVKATNSDGVWNKDEVSFRFNIIPPFWQREWFFALILFLFFASFYFYKKYSDEKQKKAFERRKQLLELNSRALSAQLNPHFIKNCLNNILYFVRIGDIDKADEYIIKFSRLIKNVLIRSSYLYVKVAKELEFLKLYIELENLGFKKAVNMEITGLEDDRIKDLFIPSLMLQVLVENSIIHGLKHKQGNNYQIDIDFELVDTNLNVSVQDNGVGMKQSKIINKRFEKLRDRRTSGMGLKNIKEQLQIIADETKQKTYFDIKDVVINEVYSGTKVEIRMPTNFVIRKNANPDYA